MKHISLNFNEVEDLLSDVVFKFFKSILITAPTQWMETELSAV